MKSLCDRHGDGTTYAAAYDTYFFEMFDFRCNAERAYKVLNVIAHKFVVEFFGCCADNLENDFNCSLFFVCARNRERNSLALCVNTKDDKLARFGFFSYERSLDIHHGDRRVKIFSVNYLIHNKFYPFLVLYIVPIGINYQIDNIISINNDSIK